MHKLEEQVDLCKIVALADGVVVYARDDDEFRMMADGFQVGTALHPAAGHVADEGRGQDQRVSRAQAAHRPAGAGAAGRRLPDPSAQR